MGGPSEDWKARPRSLAESVEFGLAVISEAIDRETAHVHVDPYSAIPRRRGGEAALVKEVRRMLAAATVGIESSDRDRMIEEAERWLGRCGCEHAKRCP